MLVFRYTHSWRDVAHNIGLFCKISLLMMIIVISAEVAWLYMVDDLTGCESNLFRHLAFDKVNKNHHLD